MADVAMAAACRFGLTHAFWYTAVRTVHSSWTYQCPPLCPIHLC